MSVKLIKTQEDFEKEIIDAGDKLVVVDFFATWCGPCKNIAPKIQEWSKEMTEVIFLKVDVDENSDTAEKYEISAMPTFLLFKNGSEVEKIIGANVMKLKEAIDAKK